MNIEFSGKTVLVTGVGHGIGRSIAHAFVENGAHVYGCGPIASDLEQTKKTASGKGCIDVDVIDITNKEEVNQWIKQCDTIDILVNNAGGVCGQVGRPIEEISLTDWQTIFDVNATGAFLCCQAVAPIMKNKRYGRIINISSGAGLGVSKTGIQAYASAKAAQIGLTRQLAHEFGPFGITVNSIAPGFIRSNPSSEKQWQAYGEEKQKSLVENIKLKRLGQPEDIAHAVLFFASDHAAWITSQILSVDGG